MKVVFPTNFHTFFIFENESLSCKLFRNINADRGILGESWLPKQQLKSSITGFLPISQCFVRATALMGPLFAFRVQNKHLSACPGQVK